MTYEEALEEAAFRLDELGGMEPHAAPEAREIARAYALETLAKLEAAVAMIHKEIVGGEHEHVGA